MARKVIDCRDYPSQQNCTMTFSGEEKELLHAVKQHAQTVHGYQDSPELETELRKSMKDESEYFQKEQVRRSA